MCSISLPIREINIKSTVRYLCIPIRILNTRQMQEIPSFLIKIASISSKWGYIFTYTL